MKVTYPTRLYFLLGIITLLLAGNLVYTYYVYKNSQREQLRQEERHQELIEATRKEGQVALMGHLMTAVERELEQDPNRRLKPGTLAKIAQLSESLKPDSFSYLTVDSSTAHSYSSERGQLLWFLLHTDMDSTSFRQIKAQSNFAQADLAGLSLEGVDLSGANLQGVNLKGANLSKANLRKADLRGANFWGAQLVGAKLEYAQLNRADFSWADLSESQLSESILKGAKLSAAQLRKANLRKAIVHYAFAKGAFFNEADLTEANLFGTDLKQSVFREAKLIKVDLRVTDLSEAVLIQADLSEALLRDIRIQKQNWLELLAEWGVTGTQKALETYEVIEDPLQQAPFVIKIKKR